MENLKNTLVPLESLIASGKLYPSVVLHGSTLAGRIEAAVHLSRMILCEHPSEQRPCGLCNTCTRIAIDDSESFHPDFRPLARDRPTVTSTAAVRTWIQEAHLTPFEARAKVFVLMEAETLGADGADALLKVLEEPPGRAARQFFLLSGNDRELSATVRSRSMSFYLGADHGENDLGEISERIESALLASGPDLSARLSAAILASDDWKDARSGVAWGKVADALVRVGTQHDRRWLFDLAADLVEAPRLRIRGIPAHRIVEGRVIEHIQKCSR